MGTVQCRDPTGCAGKQLFKPAGTDAEKCVGRETQFRFRDKLEVHEFFQRGIMRGTNVGDFELTGFDGVGKRRGLDRMAVEKTFDAWQVSESLVPP